MRKMHADFIGGSMIITLNTSKSTTTSKDKSGSYCAQRDAKVLDFVTPEKARRLMKIKQLLRYLSELNH